MPFLPPNQQRQSTEGNLTRTECRCKCATTDRLTDLRDEVVVESEMAQTGESAEGGRRESRQKVVSQVETRQRRNADERVVEADDRVPRQIQLDEGRLDAGEGARSDGRQPVAGEVDPAQPRAAERRRLDDGEPTAAHAERLQGGETAERPSRHRRQRVVADVELRHGRRQVPHAVQIAQSKPSDRRTVHR